MKRIKPATKQQATLVRQLREHYPDAEKISLAVRGDGNRLTPEPMEVVYVMSTGGKWGRSSEVRVGNRLQTMLDQRDHDARVVAGKAERKSRFDAAVATLPSLNPLRAALARLNLYELIVRQSYSSVFGGTADYSTVHIPPQDILLGYCERLAASWRDAGDSVGAELADEAVRQLAAMECAA